MSQKRRSGSRVKGEVSDESGRLEAAIQISLSRAKRKALSSSVRLVLIFVLGAVLVTVIAGPDALPNAIGAILEVLLGLL